MIDHIVLIQWKEDAPQSEREELLRALLALKHKIPGIVSYRVGENFSARSKGYDAAVTSTFVDRASLDAYFPHPEHQRVVGRLTLAIQNLLTVDFESID